MTKPLGIALPGSVTMREAEELSAEAEAAGFSSVWVTDVRREPYLTAAAALRATSRVTVGTDVAVAFNRSPAATAQAAWDLAGYSGGRFILGLGSQVGPTLLSRFGVEADHPAARMRDYVHAVRACWAAYRKGRGRYEGEFYKIRQPVFAPGADDPWPEIPIYVAGVNPTMIEIAGEVADGFAAHMWITQTYIEKVVRPALGRGAARAGRTPPPILLPLVFGRTREELALYMTAYAVPAYRRVLDESGMREEMDAILAAIADRRRTEAATILAREVIGGLPVAVAGELQPALLRWGPLTDQLGLGVPWYGLNRETQLALWRVAVTAASSIVTPEVRGPAGDEGMAGA